MGAKIGPPGSYSLGRPFYLTRRKSAKISGSLMLIRCLSCETGAHFVSKVASNLKTVRILRQVRREVSPETLLIGPPHNPEVAGSSPVSATTKPWNRNGSRVFFFEIRQRKFGLSNTFLTLTSIWLQEADFEAVHPPAFQTGSLPSAHGPQCRSECRCQP